MFYQYKVNHKKQVGQRIDKYIALNLREFSRSKIIQLIKSSNITVNNNIVDPDYKISLGDHILVNIKLANETPIIGENIKLNIVYEDKDLIVINKPAGIVMHPGAGNKTGTIVNALINHCGDELKFVGDAQRPGIVHRIDKDTSGLVVIAKNDFTHKHLSDQFASHSIERVYIAVCWNKISPANGKIKSLLSRSNRNRTKMMSSVSRGKVAITHYKTLENLKNKKNQIVATVLECRLETGRTHQIRVHLTEKGNPLIGDRTYGRSPQSKLKSLSESTVQSIKMLPGQALHAQSLGFLHPKKEKTFNFQSVMPDYLSKLVNSIKS
jgi:23S rRNA pseudouridine1911/1915/1917 synthase